MEARQPVRRRARQPTRRRPDNLPDVGPDNPDNLPDVGGRDVGHVVSDRRACRVRSSGMSGPIVGHVGPIVGHVGHVGHVGPDRRACRADFGRVVGCQKLPFSASIVNGTTLHH